MREILKFIRDYIISFVIMVWLAFKGEWVGAIGWFCVLIEYFRINQLEKYSDFLSDEVDKWYKKYMDFRYGNHHQEP